MDLEGQSKACIYFKTNKYIILPEKVLKPWAKKTKKKEDVNLHKTLLCMNIAQNLAGDRFVYSPCWSWADDWIPMT